MKEVHRF